jgi:hypothetical protein
MSFYSRDDFWIYVDNQDDAVAGVLLQRESSGRVTVARVVAVRPAYCKFSFS